MPLVSICTGTYNREDYIRICLDSVFAQSFQDFEVVIADNASTDRTVEIAATYGPRVRVIRRAVNSGTCSTTRNEAVRASRGALVAFLDSDDAWRPEKLERQVAFMRAHPEFLLCHTYAQVIDETGAERGIRHEDRIPASGPAVEPLLEHCFITISSVMIRRAVFDEIGPFREDPPYGQSGEDYDFFLRIAGRHPIGFLPEDLTLYRKSSAGITHGNWRATPKPLLFLREVARAPDAAYPGISAARRRRAYLDACATNARYWAGQGDGARCRWSAAQGWRVAPHRMDLAAWWLRGALLPRAGRMKPVA